MTGAAGHEERLPNDGLTPRPSSPGVSARMSRHPRRDTRPELRLRQALHRLGLRYRTHLPVPGAHRRSIDIAFTRRRVAVFVDGCFWHGCPAHGSKPAANRQWWEEKLASNIQRDADTGRILRLQGWAVIRIWEHTATQEAVQTVVKALESADASAGRG